MDCSLEVSGFSLICFWISEKDEVKEMMDKVGAAEASSTEDHNNQDGQSGSSGTTPDSPSKQLPDQISFFSGNPSVEIAHGIMHLYKTK